MTNRTTTDATGQAGEDPVLQAIRELSLYIGKINAERDGAIVALDALLSAIETLLDDITDVDAAHRLDKAMEQAMDCIGRAEE